MTTPFAPRFFPRFRTTSPCVLYAILNLLSLTVFLSSLPSVSSYSLTVRPGTTVRVAHIGNSMQYYYDLPRLLQQMLQLRYETVVRSELFRRGGSFPSIFSRGQRLEDRFNPEIASIGQPNGTFDLGAETYQELVQMEDGLWDYIIMSDNSSGPADNETRAESVASLMEDYAPLFPPNAVALFMVTQTYRGLTVTASGPEPYTEFLAKTRAGYEEYRDTFLANGIDAKIVDVGGAFHMVNELFGVALFTKLYSPDSIHASTYGAYLQAALVYCTITGEEPPTLDNDWFQVARYMEFRDRYQLTYEATPFPLPEEAEQLRQVAIVACGLP